ncbi:MAG: diacylglycerol kinase family protein [Dehalococcoidia bacterium]
MSPYERRETMVIVNPVAHNLPSTRRLDEAKRALQAAGWEAEWRETGGPGEATELAREAAARGLPLLFACGGDGTLNEAANGLAGSETALAPIRGGTVNIWAREMGFSRKPAEAVRQAIEGERRKMDLGRAGERYFLLMAGYGLDGAIARRASMRLKGRFGATAYAIAAVREVLRYRSSPVTLRLDGEERATNLLMLVAGNTRNYAGLTQVTRDAVADDGLLDVCLYEGRGTRDCLLHALRTLLRRHQRSKKVLYRQVKRLELSWETPLPAQLDGDAFAESPATVDVAPSALWVAVPRGLRSPLFRK